MCKKLIVPVDMEHIGKLQKSLDTAAILAKYYDAEACYAGITRAAPSGIAHYSDELRQKLESFAQQQSGEYGHRTSAKTIVSTILPWIWTKGCLAARSRPGPAYPIFSSAEALKPATVTDTNRITGKGAS